MATNAIKDPAALYIGQAWNKVISEPTNLDYRSTGFPSGWSSIRSRWAGLCGYAPRTSVDSGWTADSARCNVQSCNPGDDALFYGHPVRCTWQHPRVFIPLNSSYWGIFRFSQGYLRFVSQRVLLRVVGFQRVLSWIWPKIKDSKVLTVIWARADAPTPRRRCRRGVSTPAGSERVVWSQYPIPG